MLQMLTHTHTSHFYIALFVYVFFVTYYLFVLDIKKNGDVEIALFHTCSLQLMHL